MWILRHIRRAPPLPAIGVHLELTAPPCILNILTLWMVRLCAMRLLPPWEIPGERYSRPQKGRSLRRPAGGTGSFRHAGSQHTFCGDLRMEGKFRQMLIQGVWLFYDRKDSILPFAWDKPDVQSAVRMEDGF